MYRKKRGYYIRRKNSVYQYFSFDRNIVFCQTIFFNQDNYLAIQFIIFFFYIFLDFLDSLRDK